LKDEIDKLNKPEKLRHSRVLSKNTMPPGQRTCNSKLASRDGYCQQPGISEFQRCKHHTGKEPQEAFEIFQKSLGLDNALKLETLLNDTLNMNNELAAAKVMLVKTLEEWERMQYVKKEFIENPPRMPDIDGKSKEELEKIKEIYKATLSSYRFTLEAAAEAEKGAYFKVTALTKTLVDGIAKNKKLTEGDKFTMDIRQIREILKIQLEIMASNCAGCPKLKNIIHMMKNKMKDIIFDPSVSHANKKAAGAKAYADQLGMVEELHDKLKSGEIVVD
jgi:hypothetical protein